MVPDGTDRDGPTLPDAHGGRFRVLADAAPIGIVEADSSGTLVYVNEAWRDLAGYRGPTPIPPDALMALVHPDDRDELRARILAAADRLAQGDVTVRFCHADGAVRWAHIHAAPVPGPAGSTSFVGIADDVTEATEAQRARAESEARYRRLILDAPVPQLVSELDGTLVEFNQAFLELMRATPEEVLARGPRELIHPDDMAALAAEVARMLEGEADYFDIERRLVRPDGSVVVVTGGTALLRDGDRIRLHSVILDITERTQREQELRESETRFRTLAESLPVGVFRADPSGKFTYVNPQWLDINGIGRDELDRPDPTDIIHPDDRELLAAKVGPGLRRHGRYAVQYRIRRRDGSVRWIAGRGAVTRDPDSGEVTGIVGSIEDITDRRQLEHDLAHRATHDALTGLPNRALLLDHLELAMARSRRDENRVALLFLDLDRFKTVNDQLGHDAGDDLLRQAARRIAAVVRPPDTVARLGGDEFVVLCEAVDGEEEAVGVARRIIGAIGDEPFRLGTELASVSASIGVALSASVEVHAESLLRDADAAMYRAKEKGRARVEVYDESLHAEAVLRSAVADQLARSLEAQDITVHYQPCIDLRTARVTGVEALARWNHPERGLLLPASFIPVAEDTGLIAELGMSVLAMACRQGRRWQERFGPDAPVVHVNLSARQLTDAELTDLVDHELQVSGLAPDLLCLEITESVLMDDAPSAIDQLWDLRALGVSIAIDDFGTGFSSLSYLRRFPVDVLKVDRTFIDGLGPDPEDSAIVAAIVNLARTLELRAVAEGVETDEQLRLLRELGCDVAQGYRFSPPVEADEIDPLLGRALTI